MKPWLAWLLFAFGFALVAGATAFTSLRLLQLEEDRNRAQADAATEEVVSQALWEMDAEAAPLPADEAARPYFEYSAFYPAEAAYTRMFRPLEPGEVLVPSPLLAADNDLITLHFQVDPDGKWTSPQAPEGNLRDLAESRFVPPSRTAEYSARLRAAQEQLRLEDLRRNLPRRTVEGTLHEVTFLNSAWAVQTNANEAELRKRSDVTQKAATKRALDRQAEQQKAPEPLAVHEHPMTAIWQGETLLLARVVTVDSRDYVQGALLDWPALRARLQAVAAPALPALELRPVTSGAVASDSVRRLAALPIEVLPGNPRITPPQAGSPVQVSLYIVWACVAGAGLAAGLVLRRTLALSERRAEFVSAVTHELRTPLTTFRMYAELLRSGRVTDEATRAGYYETLHAEALRLGHLVENVLAYARLERNREVRNEPHELAPLLARIEPHLRERCVQAGMTLVVGAAAGRVLGDAGAIERVLFNLVDNACKYAATATDKRIELSALVAGDAICLGVRDYGPGLSALAKARLFEPWRKSAQAAADSAPGVGLGLSLCRRLARSMGGVLIHDPPADGGCRFCLRLPTG
ncbi:MAG: HAMP domain-containing histidine kinase [Planctomycetes bacterium]|nr:HAMP domain-containing histidine kinase [Planctomycetota bacterium]